MSGTPAISVDHIGKQYQIGLQAVTGRTFREAITGLATAPLERFRRLSGRTRDDTFWALRGVSFEVQPGEVVGIIGRNGAGKSTLLKILSRITEPTEGEATIRGRVSSLLEVGTGFHPELTGRENMFLNAAILGMRRREVLAKFDDIVDFAGIGQFLDTPIKRYSSGMKVRLAFAVAAHLEPEILIIDEVLAVGDQEFQNRCLGKMDEVAKSGRTVLFVSHNMAAVEGLCTKGILLCNGRIQATGTTDEVLSTYMAHSTALAPEVELSENPGRTHGATPLFKSFRILRDDGVPSTSIRLGTAATFELLLQPDLSPLCYTARDGVVGIHIYNQHGTRVVTFHTRDQYNGSVPTNVATLVRCTCPAVRLMPGIYTVTLGMAYGGGHDRVEGAATFEVIPGDVFGTGRIPPRSDGYFVPEATWEVVPQPQTRIREHGPDFRDTCENPRESQEHRLRKNKACAAASDDPAALRGK